MSKYEYTKVLIFPCRVVYYCTINTAVPYLYILVVVRIDVGRRFRHSSSLSRRQPATWYRRNISAPISCCLRTYLVRARQVWPTAVIISIYFWRRSDQQLALYYCKQLYLQQYGGVSELQGNEMYSKTPSHQLILFHALTSYRVVPDITAFLFFSTGNCRFFGLLLRSRLCGLLLGSIPGYLGLKRVT